MKDLTAVLLLILVLSSCKQENSKVLHDHSNEKSLSFTEEELYRPNFHFTPQKNWMNDPNGMFYLDGTYHLFYQYHPEGNKWGPMHWGHATSKDLMDWEEQEIALYPDNLGYIFSGSAVVDINNTSGFGDGSAPPVVAIFTYHDPAKERKGDIDVETQGIAYSLDKGKTWKKYNSNPVLNNPGIRNFRDPKVIWDHDSDQWVMVLAADDRVKFYGSPNLIDWTYLSDFGNDIGAHGGVWECPDFFPIQVEGMSEQKWVLLQSLNPGGPNGGSATQYFIGDFDGKTFHLDPEMKKVLSKKEAFWIDYGMDNYASVTWNNTGKGNIIYIGWMTNWLYAETVPTETWRSSMTIPRTLKLKQTNEGYRIYSKPVAQIENYFSNSIIKEHLEVKGSHTLLTDDKINLSKSNVSLKLMDLEEEIYTFYLRNSDEEILEFGLDNKNNILFMNRTNSGKVDFSEDFANKITKMDLGSFMKSVDLQLVLDKTSIEIFLNNGESVLTETFFPNKPYQTFSIKSTGQESIKIELQANQININ